MSQIKENHSVSVKLIGGDEAGIICELMEDLFDDVVVGDMGSYMSIETQKPELVFDVADIAEAMGSPFSVSRFLAILATYKGFIEVNDDNVIIRDEG
ncbi:MmoB/DmpM family protein [Zhongshania sp.]|uniref:MmoB/DmpM family protein n=1 Tax=Zhongshania sp. TaxID=1971902 RepID=UPI003566AC16